LEVTIDRHQLFIKQYTLSFPQYCCKCLEPYPDRSFEASFSSQPFMSKKITTYSVKVPICSSCHKPQLILDVCAIIGGILFISPFVLSVAGILIGAGIVISPSVLIGECIIGGLVLIIASVILKLVLRPVRMSMHEDFVGFWFKNPRYGEMFSAANSGTIFRRQA